MNGNEVERKNETPLVEASVADVRLSFGDWLNRAGFGGEHIVIVRRGKQVAALVGIPDLKRLRDLDAA